MKLPKTWATRLWVKKGQTMQERIALAIATLLTAVGIWLAPSWQGIRTDVCLQAAAIAGATIVLLYVTRLLGARGIAIERIVLALFLAAMPVVYILRWLFDRDGAGGGWLWLELLGFLVFAALAVMGLRVSPWYMAAGIAAHGVAWDIWHYFIEETYMPHWYAITCLLVDVGIGLYVAARIPAWREWQRAAGARRGDNVVLALNI
jgi:hypothetical protein